MRGSKEPEASQSCIHLHPFFKREVQRQKNRKKERPSFETQVKVDLYFPPLDTLNLKWMISPSWTS